MATHAPRCRWSSRLVCLSFADGHKRVYLDDAIGYDDKFLSHVDFFRVSSPPQAQALPQKSRLGTYCVRFHDSITSPDGVQSNNKTAAMTRMPIQSDAEQFRSLLGGFDYCHKFLPNTARRIRPVMDFFEMRGCI